MNITYKLGEETFSFKQNSPKHISRMSSLLTNPRGDFLNLGLEKNYSKFQGLTIINQKTMDAFKILDEFVFENLHVKDALIEEGNINLRYKEKKISKSHILVDDNDNEDHLFGNGGELSYNEKGQLEEVVEDQQKLEPQINYFLGPTGGVSVNIKDYEGKVFLDLDCHKLNDFDEWGREYSVKKIGSVIVVHYTKKVQDKEDYSVYFGFYSDSSNINELKDWVEKEYDYTRERNSDYKRFVYRLLSLDISSDSNLLCSAGFSEQEVLDQIDLLNKHQEELVGFDKALYNDMIPQTHFKVPLTYGVDVAYKLSSQAMYKFLNKELKTHVKNGCFAGYPWFAQVWSRDDLISTRAFIELEDDITVKEKLFSYLNLLDEETGLLPILSTPGSYSSPDASFWLGKRIEDFIYSLDQRGVLSKVISQGELTIIYQKLTLIFNKIIQSHWDKDKELIKVKYGDSWMDTIPLTYPLDLQVQCLNFISVLADFSAMLNKKEEEERYLDLEYSLRHKIRNTYYRNERLVNEVSNDDITSNVFLAYYLYPNLFLQEDWEHIFDVTLREIRLHWGGVSTLSKKHPEYRPEYSGENNESYHRGDSWFWVNNIVAIALHDLNEKKYRRDIAKIVQSSTDDMLKMGTLGFGSEVSSAKHQLAQGAQAQLWSSSTYIELIHKIYGKILQ